MIYPDFNYRTIKEEGPSTHYTKIFCWVRTKLGKKWYEVYVEEKVYHDDEDISGHEFALLTQQFISSCVETQLLYRKPSKKWIKNNHLIIRLSPYPFSEKKRLFHRNYSYSK